MLSIVGKFSIEEAKKYNRDLNEFRSKNYGGCVSTRACESCGALVNDSLCLCIGLFTCPECHQDNAANVLDWRKSKIDLSLGNYLAR